MSALVCLATVSASLADEPDRPTTLRSDKISDSQVRLTWRDQSNDEDGFEIFRLRQPGDDFQSRGTVGPNVEQFIDTVDPDDIYIYHVVAFNEDGDSDDSNECFVNRRAPLRPIDVEARLIALYVARISWFDRASGESGFAIQRKQEGQQWKTIDIVDANEEVYEDDTLDFATTYTYRVKALGQPNRCIRDSRPSEERLITTKGGVRVLTVDIGGRGRGRVRSEPEGINCGTQQNICTAEFPVNTDVTLFADPGDDSALGRWIGPEHCEDGERLRCKFNLGVDKTIGVNFQRD